MALHTWGVTSTLLAGTTLAWLHEVDTTAADEAIAMAAGLLNQALQANGIVAADITDGTDLQRGRTAVQRGAAAFYLEMTTGIVPREAQSHARFFQQEIADARRNPNHWASYASDVGVNQVKTHLDDLDAETVASSHGRMPTPLDSRNYGTW